eukprot:CAMPEP_0198666562 /NCGR_PEP_ID=MMETSP1467-20131203/65069_1 /TAXON_ID=1462469 /ORGANISM="unid. sp., Strain CCMP2135" /LENGTH=334 /DNA_ID=CAMNT_0044403211 /DNA_START=21 /DNA_END=1025 /DNA_ORIENTATION=-
MSDAAQEEFAGFSEAAVALFLARIDFEPEASREPTLATLKKVLRQFTKSIPFEQLDVALGRDIATDPPSVFDKIVRRRRGGFCFENNVLLYEMLRALGFQKVRRHVGRVLVGGRTQGLTHLLVTVELEDGHFLVDGGFGGASLREPLDLSKTAGQPQLVYPDVLRLVPDDCRVVGAGGIRMQLFDSNKWQESGEEVWLDQWASNLSEPVFDVDIAQKSFAVAKRLAPDNWFPHSRLVVLLTDTGARYLQKNKLHRKHRTRMDDVLLFFPDYSCTTTSPEPTSEKGDGKIFAKTVDDVADSDYLAVLAAEFGIADLGHNSAGEPLSFADFPPRCL